jgi:hypothetical protein
MKKPLINPYIIKQIIKNQKDDFEYERPALYLEIEENNCRQEKVKKEENKRVIIIDL